MVTKTQSQSQKTKSVNTQTMDNKEDKVQDFVGGNGDKKVRCKSLVIDGTKYMTNYNKKFENRKDYVSPDPKKILSFIPGTIVKLFVKEGQEVKPGDNMLILEAMKMKNRVVFDSEATVKSIKVQEGEKVPKNHLMVELK